MVWRLADEAFRGLKGGAQNGLPVDQEVGGRPQMNHGGGQAYEVMMHVG